MHVISRRKNESIVINGEITITVVDIWADRVRLGIVCPPEVAVRCSGLHQQRHRAPDAGSDRRMRYVDVPFSSLQGMKEISLEQLVGLLDEGSAPMSWGERFDSDGGASL
jgi:carbon storage regulator